MASNTPKNTALTETFMNENPIGYSDEMFSESLLKLVRKNLDRRFSSDQDLVSKLLKRARLNFSKVEALSES